MKSCTRKVGRLRSEGRAQKEAWAVPGLYVEVARQASVGGTGTMRKGPLVNYVRWRCE
jgi:hypothetical protein